MLEPNLPCFGKVARNFEVSLSKGNIISLNSSKLLLLVLLFWVILGFKQF